MASAHPAWCDPTECDEPAGHADIRHASAPLVWRASEDDVEVSLARYLDVQRDGTGRPVTKIALGLRAADPYGDDGTSMQAAVVLTEADVDRLVADLARLRGLGARRAG